MKNISLVIAAILIAVYLLQKGNETNMMLTCGSGTLDYRRLSYMMIHANLLHLIINLYTFLSLTFLCNARLMHFLIATIIAATIPNVLLSNIPMCGISVLNYALTGLILFDSKKWFFLLLTNLAIAALGMLFGGIAAVPHIYGLIVGFATSIIITLFTKPIFNE